MGFLSLWAVMVFFLKILVGLAMPTELSQASIVILPSRLSHEANPLANLMDVAFVPGMSSS